MDEKWFPSFSKIPGIEYAPPAGLDFSYFPYRNLTPKIEYYEFDGKRTQSIMWNYGNMSTSASPAKEWKATPRPNEPEGLTKLRELYETLELPGTLSDYHFALQNTHSDLRNYIGKETWALNETEKLCWLNIRLIEKYPETISYETDEGIHYFRVIAFGTLVDLYATEGYLRDALEVAELGVPFDSGTYHLEELKERISILESEDRTV